MTTHPPRTSPAVRARARPCLRATGGPGENAVVLASPKRDGTPSILQGLPAGTWAMNCDWVVRFEGTEEAVAVAVGATWCACATSAGYLRLFSLSGIPLAVLSLPGPVVAMAGGARHLAIAYHRAVPMDSTPHARTGRGTVRGPADSDRLPVPAALLPVLPVPAALLPVLPAPAAVLPVLPAPATLLYACRWGPVFPRAQTASSLGFGTWTSTANGPLLGTPCL